MKIEPLHCPSCLAILEASPGADRATCEYCGTISFIEYSDGRASVKSEQQWAELKQIIQDTGATTAQNVLARSEDAKREIQQLRLSQELTSVELRMTNIQAEIRSLQRNTDKKAKKTSKNRLKS